MGLQTDRTALTRARNAVPNYSKQAPGEAGTPIPEEAMWMLADHLLKDGSLESDITEVTSRVFLDVKRPNDSKPEVRRTTGEAGGSWKQLEEGWAWGAHPNRARPTRSTFLQEPGKGLTLEPLSGEDGAFIRQSAIAIRDITISWYMAPSPPRPSRESQPRGLTSE